MKKFWTVLAVFLLALPLRGVTHTYLVLIGPGHTAVPACAAGTCDGTADSTTGIVDTSSLSANAMIWVTAYCPSGPCTGTIAVQQRPKVNTSSASAPPFTTLISCSNPDANTGLCLDGGSGQMYVINTGQLQIKQSGTGAGTFGVVLEVVAP